MLTSSTQLQNRSFHDVERKRTALKCQILKNARAKRAKLLFFVAYLWRSCFRRHRGCSSSLLLNRRTATWNRSICFIHYFPIVHNALCLPPQILHKLLLWNTLGRSAYSQEHSATIVYAKFGGQTECIMGNWKIENTIKKWKSEQWRHLCVCPPIGHR